jgi:hypothetical protein
MQNKMPLVSALAGAVLLFGLASASLAAPEMRLIPVAADGDVICMPGEGDCGETEIKLAQGGVEITFFIQISGWDTDTPHPGDSWYFLGAYQATLDGATLEGGDVSGTNTMAGLDLAVSNRLGEGSPTVYKVCGTLACVIEGSSSPNCIWDELSTGAPCPPEFPEEIDRPDFMFQGCPLITYTPPEPPYTWFCASPDCIEDPRDGTRFYAGTLILDVPPGAQGTYNIGIVHDSGSTVLNSCPGPEIPGLTLTSAKITLPVIHSVLKHRYITFYPAGYGPETAGFKVDLVSLKRCSGNLERACTLDRDCEQAIPGTGTCVEHPDVGLSWWVQQAQTEPLGCLPNNECGLADVFARLADTPYFTEWSQSPVHIGDCEIIPGATYEVRRCLPPTGDVCDEPITIPTAKQPLLVPGYWGNFGDIASAPLVAGQPYGPPDGFANVTDYSAVIFTIQNYGTTKQPQAHPTWVDLHGLGDGIAPNYIINVSDLQLILKVLEGGQWTDFGGALNPGECP